MAQAGIHALIGASFRSGIRKREPLLLGVILGNLVPDLDNLAVAIATLTGSPTEGLHRTFTHSIFTVAVVILLFHLGGRLANKPQWGNLGLGLGIGILLHIIVDLLVWFDGVEVLWPLSSWVNLWEGVTPPEWWSQLMMPVEFLFMALFLVLLGSWARKYGTDLDFMPRLRIWVILLVGMFIIFTALVYTLDSGFMIPYGALYLFALFSVIGIVIRMRRTVEKVSE